MHALRSAVIPPNARAKVESLRVRRGHSASVAQCPIPSDGFLVSNFRRRSAERMCHVRSSWSETIDPKGATRRL